MILFKQIRWRNLLSTGDRFTEIDLTEAQTSLIVGTNGAGKSTIINILGGTVTKDKGDLKIWGLNIDTHRKQSKLAIGIVPQELNIDAFFTPKDQLELQAGLFNVPKNSNFVI